MGADVQEDGAINYADPLPMTMNLEQFSAELCSPPGKVEAAICLLLLLTGAGAERRLFG